MGQILIRQLDDSVIERLKLRARRDKTSVEALAREAVTAAARLSVEEKRAVVERMQAWSRQAMVPGVEQTPGWVLIREDRDHDH
jgi:antitoxin FitA